MEDRPACGADWSPAIPPLHRLQECPPRLCPAQHCPPIGPAHSTLLPGTSWLCPPRQSRAPLNSSAIIISIIHLAINHILPCDIYSMSSCYLEVQLFNFPGVAYAALLIWFFVVYSWPSIKPGGEVEAHTGGGGEGGVGVSGDPHCRARGAELGALLTAASWRAGQPATLPSPFPPDSPETKQLWRYSLRNFPCISLTARHVLWAWTIHFVLTEAS